MIACMDVGRADFQLYPRDGDHQWLLCAWPAAIHLAGVSHLTAAECPHGEAVDDRGVGVDLNHIFQGAEHIHMGAAPDVGVLRGPEPAMGDRAGSAEF